MNQLKKTYYTPAELANLAGISKQLLLYYDKQEILSPSYLDENGFRYYSLSQYFTLQVIIMLRKLDLPLKNIKEYIQHKDPSVLQDIYAQQIKEYERRIKQLEKYTCILQKRIKQIASYEDIHLNQIEIAQEKASRLFISEEIPLNQSIKDRMNILANHMRYPLIRQEFTDAPMGFILPADNFLAGNSAEYYYVFIEEDNIDYPASNAHIKEKGLFLSVYSHVRFGLVDLDTREKLNSFIKTNNLNPESDVYVFPINNYWTTSNSQEEISRICIKVSYK